MTYDERHELIQAQRALLEAETAARREHLTIENRRFAVQESRQFHQRSGRAIINIGAVLYGASVIFDYVENGNLPDLAKERQAAQEFTRTVVEAAFPASVVAEWDETGGDA